MSTVHCVRCEKEGRAIAGFVGFGGDLGARIRNEVCASCWAEWMETQIKVINEYRLHMGESAHRDALKDFAVRFLRLDGGDGSLGPGPEGGLR